MSLGITYASLNAKFSKEVQTLFDYVSSFQPDSPQLEVSLKPFIPDYIPSIGEMDPFIKIPRPDGKPDKLGLTVLDEPSIYSSDPTALGLQLRVNAKKV